jgi:hypothetical protein
VTTEEIAAAFPPSIFRPDPWPPGAAREYERLRDLAVAAENRADRLWVGYWWNDRPAAGTEAEAHTFQAVDVLLRISGLLMLDAGRIAEGVAL